MLVDVIGKIAMFRITNWNSVTLNRTDYEKDILFRYTPWFAVGLPRE